MAEEKKWSYRVETIGGLNLKFNLTKTKAIQDLCSTLGQEGWELTGMSYNCFNGRYVFVFKKLEATGSTK